MKKNKLKILIFILALLILTMPALAFAASAVPAVDIGTSIKTNLTDTGLSGLGGTTSLAVVIGSIISYILGFLGLFFILIIIYAGYMWGSAAGDDAKVKKARAMIVQATIGLVIIMTAYAITFTVIDTIEKATSPKTGTTPATTGTGTLPPTINL